MFKNLFGKKDDKPQLDKVAVAVHNSTLKMMTHEVFMHYFDENTKPNHQDPGWQNQEIYFWLASEPFEKKSLPPTFKKLEEKYFVVNKVPQGLSFTVSEAMPWFGMPGGGKKHCFAKENAPITISSLINSNVISYIHIIDLHPDHLEILKDRANYCLLLDSGTMRYEPMTDRFFFKDQKVSLGEAYQLGGVKVIKTNT